MAERYDWLSSAILRFIRRVVKATEGHEVDVAVCGEMGGRTLEALALMGIGIRRLSITPAAVGPIKAMIRSTRHSDIRAKMEELLDNPTENLREELTSWAIGQGIEIG